MDRGVIVIIDGNSLINRAYYAMQRPMITKDGLYTQGVYGFINILERIIRERNPRYIAVTFDMKGPTFRHEEYEEYKAGRKKMPMELAMQLPLLKDVLKAMNITYLELDGFEADDIIGTVAKKAEEEGLAPLIITGDKDELQLATHITRVVITKKGISEFEEYDHQAMIDKYGFTPQQFIDYKGLMGDQSDNIPGVPGVGEKTASTLIKEYGSIENLLEKADEIDKEGLRNKIKDNRTLALMSKRLATIDTNVPIDFDIEDFILQEADQEALIENYKKLEFNSFLKRMKIEDVKGGLPRETETLVPISVEGINTIEDLNKANFSSSEPWVIHVFSDENHQKKPLIHGISLLIAGKGYYITNENKGMLGAFFEKIRGSSPKWAGHNLQSDWYSLLSEVKDIPGEIVFDSAIAGYVLDPSRSNYHLNTLSSDYFHRPFPDLDDFVAEKAQIDLFSDNTKKYGEYGALWCQTVWELRKIMEGQIKDEDLDRVFHDIEIPLIEVLAHMEKEGFSINKEELQTIGIHLTKTLEELTYKIYELSGEEFNINSPQQLSVVLFENMGLPHGKKTTRGYSTGADTLENLKDKHPIIPLILEYRTLAKLKSTYIEGLLALIHQDGKIHAHFQQTVASTGRISCTAPNLQNIPIRQELGRTIRKAFTAGPDNILMSADYSQIELRILAHLSDDDTLIEAFNNDEDIHRITASKVLGIPEGEITNEERNRAKAVNFGVIYGMSGFGLSEELSISRKEADIYIREYFKKYHKVKDFLDKLVKDAKDNGYSLTIFQRKRPIPEITASNYMTRQMGERLAMNSPIQGSAADIIKIAMIEVSRRLKREKLKSKLILQVHDELIIEVDKKEKDRVEALLSESMENAVSLKVKLAVALNTGDNWYDLK
ncbi:MAG: DNA polymerase I [Anaerovoracaceae bacterium]|jgi:DNA polymerase-1|nr:DNA polymerase I [Anaerovoracaceae bacterium]